MLAVKNSRNRLAALSPSSAMIAGTVKPLVLVRFAIWVVMRLASIAGKVNP
jgi:hypothetical protein